MFFLTDIWCHGIFADEFLKQIDMRKHKLTLLLLLFGFILPATWCDARGTNLTDGYSHIQIKESNVQGTPRSSSIQATINGHALTVSFTENLGQVAISVTTSTGSVVECLSTITPNGVILYIPNAGDYIVNFTLPNGDEYYGEFTVTE